MSNRAASPWLAMEWFEIVMGPARVTYNLERRLGQKQKLHIARKQTN